MNELEYDKKLVENLNFNPYYQVIESEISDKLVINHKNYINLASNDYLNLGNNRQIKKAAMNAIKKYGVSLCGTPIATGYNDLYKEVEYLLADFIGLEEVVIYPSCYQANNGLFQLLVNKNDTVIVDHYVHSSLINGIKSTGCKIKPFLHNNINHLSELLKKTDSIYKTYIVTESVFSTEGSIAPFDEMVKLVDQANAMIIVDDSHGMGVLGRNGKGILEYWDIKNFNGIYTASLGKAMANAGGIIGGKKAIVEQLRYYSPHLIYSTAISPAILGGIKKTLEIIKNEFVYISLKMWENSKIINQILINSGFELNQSQSPINSVICGNKEKTLQIAKLFYDENIFVTPFIEPAVPKGKGVVRLIAGANLKTRTIKKINQKISKIGKQYREIFYHL